MASLAFNFFRSSRPAPVQPPELVAADASALRDMSMEIPRKWRLLDGLTAELGQIAGVQTVAGRPEQQFFPIAAELAGGQLRDAIAAELTDLIDLLEPAVEIFSQAPRLSQGDLNMVHNLLEQVTAVRMRMLASIPTVEA
ncbi:MAG: hypothetical protein EBR34_08815 [Sphingomonadaceae bacterium]|nr:hypothetical protein [Sphingomonadaceae bacterium]